MIAIAERYDIEAIAAARPFIKWAGGKTRMIEQYEPFFSNRFSSYYEPFLGGGAMFFHLAPRIAAQGGKAFLSDANAELVIAYQCVRDNVERLIELLREHKKKHCKEHYYDVRANPPIEPLQASARMIYLNKTCYNGLYRLAKTKGDTFNVPMGKYKNPPICDEDNLRAASAALQIAELSISDFDSLDYRIQKNALVYFDPPYHPVSETSRFTNYTGQTFTALHQARLRVLVDELVTHHGVAVRVSNSDCPFIRTLYKGMQIETVYCNRSINSPPLALL